MSAFGPDQWARSSRERRLADEQDGPGPGAGASRRQARPRRQSDVKVGDA